MNDGIEKLEECAYGMDQMQCNDVLALVDQIEREHEEELQELRECYKTHLREAREARDIAIKEAAGLRDYVNFAEDLVHNFRRNIAIMLGISCDGMADDVYDAIKAELDRRLMPHGMEWPRFEDGKQITWDDAPEDIAAVCISLDGSCFALHYDMPDDERMCIYEVSERVKRPVTEVLGADGLPIKVGETVYGTGSGQDAYTVVSPRANDQKGRFSVECVDRAGWKCMVNPSILTHTQPDTQERIDEDVCKVDDACTYFSSDGSCVKCKLVAACPGVHELDRMVVSYLLRRQRELDAKTMGGVK